MESGKRLENWEEKIRFDLAAVDCPLEHLRCFQEIDSTMTGARAMLSGMQASDRGLILAEHQTRGRGRQGRSWSEPQTGFFGTYICAATSGIGALPGFSLVVGVAVAQMIENLGGSCLLKWPNDVLSETGAKLSGVLVEIVTENNIPWVLTGIGINLRGEPHLDVPTTSVATLSGRQLSPVDAACLLTPLFFQQWSKFSREGFSSFSAAWTERAYKLHQKITVDNGMEKVSGIFRGINERGGLILERGSEIVEVISGHVVA